MQQRSKLAISPEVLEACRTLAHSIAREVVDFAEAHTTRSIERASLRILGVADAADVETFAFPLVNRALTAIELTCGLQYGAILPLFAVMEQAGTSNVSDAAELIATRQILPNPSHLADRRAHLIAEANRRADRAITGMKQIASKRAEMRSSLPPTEYPWLYVIVATGNILEDIRQAKAAAVAGVDVIAIIRSTAQSLLDFVPSGVTTEGYGGTYATQANFRLMRASLDEVGEDCGRYIRQTNFASGLCMPEMAALAALEGLDVMLNDSLYGIIFRDINMQRTFIDQHFSRRLHASCGIMINTGEDAYIKVDDPITAAHTVLASNFINEALALEAGMPRSLIGLGRAAEIDPATEGQVLLEIAHAQLARECFPDSPMKWMPPTRYLNGDIFKAYLYNGVYNLVGAMTSQDIILLGMLTEGVHNPFIADRDLAIDNARYILRAAKNTSADLLFSPDGVVQRRAAVVLNGCHATLTHISDIGLFSAIQAGVFAQVQRSTKGGYGLDGVITKSQLYFNPVVDKL